MLRQLVQMRYVQRNELGRAVVVSQQGDKLGICQSESPSKPEEDAKQQCDEVVCREEEERLDIAVFLVELVFLSGAPAT